MKRGLKDKQSSILNEIAYLDLPIYWEPGDNLYKTIKLIADTSDNADQKSIAEWALAGFEEKGNEYLKTLEIKDYANNNPGEGGTNTGFAAIAFTDPATGAVGVSFRGTEGMENLLNDFTDMSDNIQTALLGESPQARESLEFFEKNKNKYGGNYLYE